MKQGKILDKNSKIFHDECNLPVLIAQRIAPKEKAEGSDKKGGDIHHGKEKKEKEKVRLVCLGITN